jgi:DNA-binding CsgD family transcriptional regulator
MNTPQATLAEIIGAMGDDSFMAVAADSVRAFLRFDLGAVVVHKSAGNPTLLFDNFDIADGQQGIRNYVGVTHAINPIIANVAQPGAFRARDVAVRLDGLDERLAAYVVRAADEELGFRTVGWPQRLEEIGLYFNACGGLVELSVYRPRGRSAAPAAKLLQLQALSAPMAAAFDRHMALTAARPATAFEQQTSLTAARLAAALNPQTALTSMRPATPFNARAGFTAMGPAAAGTVFAALSRREMQVAELLLAGCGSEAIALRLDISRHTVKDHRKQIFRKLGVGTLAALFALHRDIG